MRYKDVAIIGMSMRFPGVDSKEKYRNLLINKQNRFGLPSTKRLQQMKCDEDSSYLRCGYLDSISEYDYEYFNINKKEAELMSPEQRICLEMAAEAILDAGYSLEGVRGSNCAVFLCGSDMDYENYINRATSTSLMGSMRCMLSGKIGYHFDLRGENMTFDSGCSSALAAVHYGCEKLSYKEADMALVGGIQLFTKPLAKKNNEYQILGIISKNEQLRVFGEDADGTLPGEGGGFVLLKPLDKAIEDSDYIYGVIEAGALNSDGARCVNVSMPSTIAQKEVVLSAWENTDISRITEVEAHSIGSAVGDAVEIQGLIEAIKSKGTVGHKIKLGTCKQNVGHLFSMSGMAGLLKVLTGYYYNETYPLIELGEKNSMIDFDSSDLEVLVNAYHWEESQERLTAISAFGLAGSNAHILVRNYPKSRKNKNADSDFLGGVIKLSARSIESFEENKKSLVRLLEEKNISLKNIAYTLNNGRDDYSYRDIIRFNNRTEFKNALENAKPIKVNENRKKPFIAYVARYENKGFEEVFSKVCIFKELNEMGLNPDTVIADKLMTEAFKAESFSKEDFEVLEKEYEYVEKEQEFKKVLRKLEEQKLADSVKMITFDIKSDSDVYEFVKGWFKEGLCIDEALGVLNDYIDSKRVPMPYKLFDNVDCWINVEKDEAVSKKDKESSKKDKEIVKEIGKEIAIDKEIKFVNNLPTKNVFLLKGENIYTVDIHKYPYTDLDFRNVFEAVSGKVDLDCKLAMYKKLIEHDIKPDVVLADQRCGALIQYAKKKISKDGLIVAASASISDGYEKIYAAVEKLSEDSNVIVYDFCYSEAMLVHQWNSNVKIVHLMTQTSLDDCSTSERIEKIEKVKTEKSVDKKKAEDFLEKIWLEALNCDGPIDHDEDFFCLGGNSLVMQMLSVEINEHFKTDFDIFEIYDYETIEKLAGRILEVA